MEAVFSVQIQYFVLCYSEEVIFMTREEFLKDYCREFSLVGLLYDFDTGNLAIRLRRSGLEEMALQIEKIPKNAYCLQELYHIFGWDYNLTEDEIRQKFTSPKQL